MVAMPSKRGTPTKIRAANSLFLAAKPPSTRSLHHRCLDQPSPQIKHSRPRRFFGTIKFRGLDGAANRLDRKPT
jgi:hypothetical protein